jgi:hypothetical protein
VIEMSRSRSVKVALVALLVVALLAFARGRAHHRGEAVGERVLGRAVAVSVLPPGAS